MLTTLIMLAAGAGAVFGLMKMKQGLEWGKGVLIACTILALILAVYKILNPMGGGTSQRELARKREDAAAYQRTAGEKLGRELAKEYPGAKAVVMRPLFFSDVDPGAPPEVFSIITDQRLAGLEAGFGDAIQILAVIHPSAPEGMLVNIDEMKRTYKEETGEEKVPLDYYEMSMGYGEGMGDMMDVSQFNDFARKIPADATMVIMLMDFPDELKRISLWNKKLTVAGIVDTTNATMADAIKEGYISAVVIGNPKSEYTAKRVPKDMDERFSRYFLLVTPDNVQAIAEANENLFQQAE